MSLPEKKHLTTEEYKDKFSKSAIMDQIIEYIQSDRDMVAIIDSFKAKPYGTFLFNPTKNQKMSDLFIVLLDEFPAYVKVAIKNILVTSWCNDKVKLDDVMKDIHVKITDSTHVKFGELAPKIENIPVSFNCVLIMWENEETYTKSADFFCEDCGSIQKSKYDLAVGKMMTPKCNNKECGSEGKYMTIHPATMITGSIRNIIIQEPIEEAFMGNPKTKRCVLRDDDVYNVYLGQKLTIVGVFRSFPRPKGRYSSGQTNEIVIQAISVKPTEESRALMPTEEQLEKFRKLTKREDFENIMAESYAPHIYGEKFTKTCIWIFLINGNTVVVDGSKLRGVINIFTIGDPGMAKTKLMEYMQVIYPSSGYVNGRMSSGAGLTVSLDRADGMGGKQMPRIGPALMFDKLAVDEFGRMGEEDQSALHQLMESGTVTFAKGGYYFTQERETAIWGGGNPVGDYYDTDSRIVDNAGISKTLMERFDITVVMIDEHNQVEDSRRVDHTAKFRGKKFIKKEESLTVSEMKSYIAYASKLEPELTDEATKEIKKFYLDMRSMEFKRGDRRIDRRMNENLIRVSTAIAKWYLSDTVTAFHVQRCIKLYKDMFATFKQVLGKDPDQMALGPTVETKEQAIIHTFRKLEKEVGDEFLSPDIIIANMWRDFGNLFKEIEDSERFFELCDKQNRMQVRHRKYRWVG